MVSRLFAGESFLIALEENPNVQDDKEEGTLMLISEVIKMLEAEKVKHGDIAVYVDMDYGEREVDLDINSSMPGTLPEYNRATANMPERIVI